MKNTLFFVILMVDNGIRGCIMKCFSVIFGLSLLCGVALFIEGKELDEDKGYESDSSGGDSDIADDSLEEALREEEERNLTTQIEELEIPLGNSSNELVYR